MKQPNVVTDASCLAFSDETDSSFPMASADFRLGRYASAQLKPPARATLSNMPALHLTVSASSKSCFAKIGRKTRRNPQRTSSSARYFQHL